MAFARSKGMRVLLALAVLSGLAAGVGGVLFYYSFVRDLPDMRTLADYSPALTSVVLDRKGRPIGEFYEEHRRIASLHEIPLHARLAFVAAEDSAFFRHSGIDYVSIIRAAWVDLRAGGIKQGASTITMQMVKQLLLSPERRFRRKIREMILARRIEQHFSKDEILYLYLNQIYFGNGSWGIAQAARGYFDKHVSEISISEAALLAGLPQRPSTYSPFSNPTAAESRRRYVLGRMLADGFINQVQYDRELAAPPEIRRPAWHADFATAAYFTEEVRRQLFELLGGKVVLNEGLVVETTLDLDLQAAAVQALGEGLRAHDRRQGYRGPMRQVEPAAIPAEALRLATENDLVPDPEAQESAGLPVDPRISLPIDTVLIGVVTAVDRKAKRAIVAFAPGVEGRALLEDVKWARPPDKNRRAYSMRRIDRIFSVGDVALFERITTSDEGANEARPRLSLYQEPTVEGGLLALEVAADDERATGNVLAMVGGYDFERSQFNRVTQARRQPGSAFKPFIYGAAIAQGYSAVSTVWDRPAVFEDPVSGFVWRPQNYGRKFHGPMTMRAALSRSVNNATVHLFQDLGVDFVIGFAKRLGIQSTLSRDLSLALGSSGASLLELTTAYAVFPNHGRRVVPHFINRVTDRSGKVLLERVSLGDPPPVPETPPPGEGLRERLREAALAEEGEALAGAEGLADTESLELGDADEPIQLITEETAYLMCDLLKAVVYDPRGTGKKLKVLHRPVAGKTGTTNDQADAWFMGFSPDIATGVWVGYDESTLLGFGETGGGAAAPIWIDFMREALRDREVRDFDVPNEIVFRRIDRESGLLANASTKDAYFQPFVEGTEPTESAETSTSAADARRALREDFF